VAWNALAIGGTLIGQLCYTIVTSRLISPHGFGAYAVAQALVTLSTYFTLNAAGSAVMRSPSKDYNALISTATQLAASIGLVAILLVLLAAPFWARVWHVEDATPLVRLIAVQIGCAPTAGVLIGALRRRMRFRAAGLVEMIGALAGDAVGIIIALVTYSPVALALGQDAAIVSTLILAAALIRPNVFRAINGLIAREIFGFSGQVGLQHLGFYLLNTAPSLVIARTLGTRTLGYYSRAYLLVSLPLNYASDAMGRTLYPVYTALRDDKGRAASALTNVLIICSAISFVGFGALAASAKSAVSVALGPRFTPAVPLVVLMALFGSINFPFSVAGSVQERLSWMRSVWIVQGVMAAALAGGIVVSLLADAGALAILFSFCVAVASAHLVQLALLARHHIIDGPRLAGAYAIHASAGVATFALVRGVQSAFGDTSVLVVGLLQAALGGALVLMVVAIPWLPAARALSSNGIRLRFPKLTDERRS
jgi:O-antigen/teichoic acid export membrane protein